MTKEEIIEELDTLKLRILIDGVEKSETDLKKYNKWLDEIKGKDHYCYLYSKEYAKYKVLASMVYALYRDKYGKTYNFAKNQEEIANTIQEAAFMTMFVEKYWSNCLSH